MPITFRNPSTPPAFTGVKKLLWPVEAHETKKVLALSIMMLFTLFNYTILRDAKDGLIVTAPGAGAESISFLKLYGSLSFAVIVMMLYSKLSLIMSRQKLFYSMISMFVIFYIIFGYFLFPMRELLHASPETIQAWQVAYPRFHWIIPLIGNWTYSLFYISAELWGSVGLSVLFWQLANDINTIDESKRFYPLFGFLSSFGIIISGVFLLTITNNYMHLEPDERWSMSMRWIINAVLLSLGSITLIYTWIYNNIFTKLHTDDNLDTHKPANKKKNKPSFKESMQVVLESRYIALIMTLIICYAVCLNLVEVTWKSQIKLQFPETSEYVKMMGTISISTGITTMILMIIGSNVLRRFGWFACAILTPIILTTTGALFFSFIIFKDSTAGFLSLFGLTPLFMSILIGWGQNILTKGAKYSMFDPTKEMAYIPLADGLKIRGKAAADGIGGRLGKSLGAMIQQFLLVVIVGSTQLTLTPIIAILFFMTAFIWVIAVVKLHKEFNLISTEDSELEETSSCPSLKPRKT